MSRFLSTARREPRPPLKSHFRDFGSFGPFTNFANPGEYPVPSMRHFVRPAVHAFPAIMKTKSILTLTAILLMNTSFIGGAKAAVIILFEEIGGNVVATTTGSFQVPLTAPDGSGNAVTTASGSILLLLANGDYDYWGGGSFTPSGLVSLTPLAVAGSVTFGYQESLLFLPSGLTGGESFFPDTAWTWEGQTLASAGLSYLTTTPFQVYERGGQTISFALVPEPTTTALFIGGVAFAALRRRRKQASADASPAPGT